jgi:hypothetical protein
LVIDFSSQKLQELCAILNEFALPRAIIDLEKCSFLAWNSQFLKQTGYSEEQIKSADPEEFLILGESWFPLSGDQDEDTVEFTSSVSRRASGGEPTPGYVVRSHGKIGYVMVDVFDSPSAEFDKGRIAGQEEERNRIVKAYHEEVSSSMIAALFLMEMAKSELQEAGLPQAEAVEKASNVLIEATAKMAEVLNSADGT